MDLHKSSLMKSILEKVGSCLKLPEDEFILTDLSDLMKKCHYLKIRTISNEYISGTKFSPDKVKGLIDAFRSQLPENGKNTFLKRHKSQNISNSKDDNISLSSDDLGSEDSEPSIKCRRRNNQKYAIESDSDIEIIDDDVVVENSSNSRKRHSNNSKENIDIHKHPRYEFRERKSYTKPIDPTNTNRYNTRSVPVFYAQEASEVIQIEDSSDEDVQEIKRETNGSFNNHRKNAKNYKTNIPTTEHPPTQADPSQLASIPLIVQFPTMQSATFNGHLYISHNHKFSVKLQGVDPRNFRWN